MNLIKRFFEQRQNDKAIRQFFTIVDGLLKDTSVGTIGGFKPEQGLQSWFGGSFWMPEEVAWPEWNGLPMLPLMQVVISDLPYRPALLAGIRVLQVFIDQKELPMGFPSINGDGFLVVTYSTETLSPREAPFQYDYPKAFPMQWSQGSSDAPTWEETTDLCDGDVIMNFIKAEGEQSLFHDRYQCLYATKFGGWPSYAQGAPANMGEFVFQIASEDKAHWSVSDSGALFFHINERAEWTLYWDSC